MLHSSIFTRLGTSLIAASLLLTLACSDDGDTNNKPILKGTNTSVTATMTSGTVVSTNTTVTSTTTTGTTSTSDTTATNTTGSNTAGTNTGTSTSTNLGRARAQLLHLVEGAGAVDVYINGTRTLDDFAELTGTEFLDLPAGSALDIKVFAGTDADNTGTPLLSSTATPEAGKAYTIAVAGDPTAAVGGDDLRLLIQDGALEKGSDATAVSVRIIHASPGAGKVDLVSVGLPAAGTTAEVVKDAEFGAITPAYISLPTAGLPYGNIALFDIRAADSDAFIANAQTPALTGFADASLTVAAVGSRQTNTFKLVAFPATGGAALTLNAGARAQLIHNSPSKGAAEEVDVFLKLGTDYKPFFNDLGYRGASPFVSIPSGGPVTAGIDLDNDPADVDVKDLTTPAVRPGMTVALVASGIVADAATPFRLVVVPVQEEMAPIPGVDEADGVQATFFHGSPNAPAVGVRAAGTTTALFPTFSYLDATPPVLLDRSVNAVLEIYQGTKGESDATVKALFKTAAPLDVSMLPRVVFIAASGLIGDSDKPLGLIAVTSDGTVIQLALELISG